MDHIRFDPAGLEEIPLALQQCTVPSRGSAPVNHHLVPLRQLADRLGASEYLRRNMEYLATGSGDLAIILTEPSDREEDVLYTNENDCCETIRILDDTLRFAFKGQRDVKNTVVLDARPLRMNRIRQRETEEKQKENDEEAYRAVEEALALLRPEVVVVCNCDSDGIVKGIMPEYLRSSVSTAGRAAGRELPNRHPYIRVPSFHPMYFARTAEEETMGRKMREYLFHATLVVGANALVGRQVSGPGISDLQCYEKFGFTVLWDLDDVTPDETIRVFERLKIDKVNQECSEVSSKAVQLILPQEYTLLCHLLKRYRNPRGKAMQQTRRMLEHGVDELSSHGNSRVSGAPGRFLSSQVQLLPLSDHDLVSCGMDESLGELGMNFTPESVEEDGLR